MNHQPSLFHGSEAYGDVIPKADHDGATYEPALDRVRLNAQLQRVFDLMKDGAWRTLGEIAAATGDPEASCSARLRDSRKRKFGGHTVNRRRRGDGKNGLHEYQLLVNEA